MKEKIAITCTSFGKNDQGPLKLLEKKGIKTVFNPYGRKLKKEEIIALCKDSIGIIAGTENYEEDILNKFTSLKVISRCGAGMDNVDLKVAAELGIKVCCTPDGPTLAVAELTVGLMLDLLRKVTLADRNLRGGIWEKQMGNILSGKRIGIVGLGRIGKKVAELLMPFGVDIAYYDIRPKNCALPYPLKPLMDLLSWADIITLHCSATSPPKVIIGKQELRQMKRGSWLINVSRGGLVDEEALYIALKEDYLSGAAIDVYEEEPYNGPLRELENTILTPHIGSYAKESRIKMEMEAVRNLLEELKNK